MTPRSEPPPPRPRHVHRCPSAGSKLSLPSSSQSNEADDEQSLSDASFDMESNIAHQLYPGQDTRLTSDRELSGFYMYGWAAEVFVVCGIGSFIPVTLEQLARENGVLLSDRSTPCKAALPAVSPSSGVSALFSPHRDKGQCVVNILGVEINTASFAMYTFSISVLVQALLIVSMSGAADHGRFRKKLLLSFAFIGSIATMLFIFVVPSIYLVGALLAIIANTCFGASFVLLNSFLPLLVRFHPTVQYAPSDVSSTSDEDDIDQDLSDEALLAREARYATHVGRRESMLDEVADATTALLPPSHSVPDLTAPRHKDRAAPSPELALSTKISSYGIAIGYIAALLVQTLAILIVITFRSSNFGLRLVLLLIGGWWFLFSIPSAIWLRARPGPPLHLSPQTSRARTALAYFTFSWRSLGRTITHARRLKDVLFFLAAWFLLSDSIATVSGTAVLFAKTTLGMSYAMLALINVIATLSGVLGAFTWSRISHSLGLSPVHTILACIALFELIPLYGLLGYIPAVQRLGFLGLQAQWEMYVLGAVYGFVLGGLSAYCRALFGELIPPGYEAAFYALYAITDKGSSVFGPAIVGAITDAAGEIRPAFWFLAVLVGLPFPIMMLVDVDRGRDEAARLADTLAGLDSDEPSDHDGDYEPLLEDDVEQFNSHSSAHLNNHNNNHNHNHEYDHNHNHDHDHDHDQEQNSDGSVTPKPAGEEAWVTETRRAVHAEFARHRERLREQRLRDAAQAQGGSQPGPQTQGGLQGSDEASKLALSRDQQWLLWRVEMQRRVSEELSHKHQQEGLGEGGRQYEAEAEARERDLDEDRKAGMEGVGSNGVSGWIKRGAPWMVAGGPQAGVVAEAVGAAADAVSVW